MKPATSANLAILERHHDKAERAYCDALAAACDTHLPPFDFAAAERWRAACDRAAACAWNSIWRTIREADLDG